MPDIIPRRECRTAIHRYDSRRLFNIWKRAHQKRARLDARALHRKMVDMLRGVLGANRFYTRSQTAYFA